MEYKGLFIWVEGEDDARFFENIMIPQLQKEYNFVKMIRYATMKREKINNFLKSIKLMSADYICVTDINSSPCVTSKKQKVKNNIRNIDEDRIIIVIKEIESWYLAGLSDIGSKKIKMRIFRTTDTITKEQFNNLIPKNVSRVNFMLEILKIFSIKIAKRKNKSFRYYIKKHNCESSENINN